MQNLATTRTPAETSPLSIRHFSTRLVFTFLFFGALWFILSRQLSGEWSVNEQYNYGWFVPLFALYLFWLRWQDRPGVEVRSQKPDVRGDRRAIIALILGIPALLLLLPVRLFEIANPDWRLLDWIHAASVVTLTLLYIWYVGGKPWLRHFVFPVAFFFVAVPWPTPVETPVIQGLMHIVAAGVTETIALFGIPAQLEGNLIRVTSGLVGVNEACSGARSLQTSLMIGLLFGELKRLSVSRRVALVTGAIAIALIANFLRAFFLVWIAATKSTSEISRWHDIAGYTIVTLVFVGSLILAALLGHKKEYGRAKMSDGNIKRQISSLRPVVAGTMGRRANIEHGIPCSALPVSFLVFALSSIVAVEAGAQLWYHAHENNLVATTRWDVRWPVDDPNFHELKIDSEVRRVLRFDQGRAAVWTLPTASAEIGSVKAQQHYLSFVSFPLEAGPKQRAPCKLASAGCLFAGYWVEPGGGHRSAQLSGDRLVHFAISPFRISSWRLRSFGAADCTRFLLLIGRPHAGSFCSR